MLVAYQAAFLEFLSPDKQVSIDFKDNLIMSVLVILVAGTLFASFEVLYFTRLFRRISFGFTLAIKTLFYVSIILICLSIATLVMNSIYINKPIFHNEVIINYAAYISSTFFLMTILVWGFSIFLGLFILLVSEKFGQGVLINFLLGKYHQPKEEKRIFMFMDLKSSTTYAEKLGHIQYSQLIQDCFYDLTDIVTEYNAKIYQYVGDEVVLSWEIDSGLDHGSCVNTFFAYDQLLQGKSKYYTDKYGIVPEFKAGLNLGEVTVAEVGVIKKELAYHGDVLNTASRIQGTCNEYQKKLLASEAIKTQLERQSSFGFDFLGNVVLKGKAKTVNIYAVNVA
jgi:adenylate cyclase